MRLDVGAICRTTTGLNMRLTPDGEIVATLQQGVIVEAKTPAKNGWGSVCARGWTLDGKTIYHEPDVSSGLKLTTRGGWRWMEISGWVAVRYLDVVDGPA